MNQWLQKHLAPAGDGRAVAYFVGTRRLSFLDPVLHDDEADRHADPKHQAWIRVSVSSSG